MSNISYDTILTSPYLLEVNQIEEEIDVSEEEAKMTVSTQQKLAAVISGEVQAKEKLAKKKIKQQIGYKLGNFKRIESDPMIYSEYKHTDRGYLLQFEATAEAKFISTNFIF
jgi:hypothetical protein